MLKTRHLRSPPLFDLTQLLFSRWPFTWRLAVNSHDLISIHLFMLEASEFSGQSAHSLQHNSRPCWCITLPSSLLIIRLNSSCPTPPHAHLYFEERSLQITRKVTTFYYRMTTGISYLKTVDYCHASHRGEWRSCTQILSFIWPLDISLHILSAEEALQHIGTLASHHSILCDFPCGTSVASNCTQEYGRMMGFNRAVLVGAVRQTSKFRWHHRVHFNYPLILFALNKAHAEPDCNGLS